MPVAGAATVETPDAAAAPATTVDCRFADVERADPKRSVGSLPAEFAAVCGPRRRASRVGAFRVGAAAVATGVTTAVEEVVVSSGAAVVSALPDVVELVWAPPVLTTTPRPAGADADSEDVDVVPDDDPGADVIGRVGDPADVFFGPDPERSTEPEVSGAESDPDDARGLVDDDPDEPEEEGEAEDELDVSAHATPCPVATAAPTPKATANPPTRPTYDAAFIVLPHSALALSRHQLRLSR